MQDQILQVDENMLETRLDRLVSEKVEQLLNAMLDAEADEITGAARYERTGDRKAYRVGHYERDLTVKAGTVTLKVPKLKGALFESAVIERYRRREQSVEEALIDMYLAGVSTRQVDDISRLLWGERMPSQTLSDKLKGVYAQIDEWRNRPLERSYPYLFVDGVWHKRTWGGSVENVSVLVAIGVDDTGHRCISSSRCFVFSHVFFSGLGSCMHFPYFSGCAEVFLPNMRASLTRRLWPVNSRSRPWCTMRSMIAAASLSSAKTVPHLLNSMFVVNMMLRLS